MPKPRYIKKTGVQLSHGYFSNPEVRNWHGSKVLEK